MDVDPAGGLPAGEVDGMTAPWSQYSESELAGMAVHDNVAAKRLEMRYQDEDRMRGVNGYGKGGAAPGRPFTVLERLTWWALLAFLAFSLLGAVGWLQLTSALTPSIRSTLEGSPVSGVLASTEGGADGNPAMAAVAYGLPWLVLVVGLTLVKRWWRRRWVRSPAGRFHLVTVAWLLTLARTAIFFFGVAVALTASAVAYGVDLAPDHSPASYPGAWVGAAMFFPVLIVSYPFVTSTFKRSWRDVDRLRESGYSWTTADHTR